MSKIKVLKIDKIFVEAMKNGGRYIHFFKGPFTEITPIFRRNGLYLSKDTCWIEFEGKAYLYEKDLFLQKFKTINSLEIVFLQSELNLIESSKKIDRKKYFSKEFLENVNAYEHVLYLKKEFRKARIVRKKILEGKL